MKPFRILRKHRALRNTVVASKSQFIIPHWIPLALEKEGPLLGFSEVKARKLRRSIAEYCLKKQTAQNTLRQCDQDYRAGRSSQTEILRYSGNVRDMFGATKAATDLTAQTARMLKSRHGLLLKMKHQN